VIRDQVRERFTDYTLLGKDPDVPRIISPYRQNTAPPLVARWENHAEQAATDEAAQVQLTYDMLLQLRVVKLLLIWVLVVVPIIVVIGLFVLTGALESEPSSRF
jgi:hypothetical protein